MDYFPLPPKGDREDNHDITHIIRESFQDVLNRQPFPENISENAVKFKMDHEMLKEEAETVNTIFEDVQRTKEGFEDVECNIMVDQGDYLIKRDAIERDVVLTEILKLKRVETFKDLKGEEVEHYSLVQKDDLLPHHAERLIDFRINTSKHGCTVCLMQDENDLDLIPSKLHIEKSNLNPLRKQDTCTITKIVQQNQQPKSDPVKVFLACPKVIKFEDYEAHITYEKAFKLKNISKKTQTVVLHTLPKNKEFSVQAMSNMSKVAPGMSIHYKVLFRTIVYKDLEDLVSFKTYGGQTLEVRILCTREPPALQTFICKDIDSFLNKVDSSSSSTKLFDDSRASALNYTFDCGPCLLGDKNKTSILIRNEGGRGSFFLMTEDDWYFGDVKSIDQNYELNIEEFEVCPSYFAIDKDEFVELQITFVPLHFGLHVQKCFLLCNNTTYEEFEIIGDGAFFEKHFIEFQVTRKNETLSYFDSESEFHIYMGECLPQIKKSCIVSISNTSCLNFSCRWELRKSVSHNKHTKLKQMDEDWIKITNQNSSLFPRSTTDFEVIVNAKSYDHGLYSIVLGLYITDVPEASLAENTNFTVVYRSKKDDSPTPELLDVLVGEIEIACDIVSTELLLVPPQMILPIELQPKESIMREVSISTSGQFTLRCKWKVFNKRNGQKCCVKIKPVQFILQPNTVQICTLTICAHTCESIQEKLILFANDGLIAKEYNVLVKVSSPKIDISTSILDFGHITIDLPLEKRFALKNLHNEEVHWQLFEFTYDFNQKKLVEIQSGNISPQTGIFKKCGETKDIVYHVNAKEVHRWFSFLMLLITHPVPAILETPILVIYEVCQPKIVIHTPTSTSPILCISELLHLDVTIHAVICMHNASNVKTFFQWGSPVGKQKDCVTVRFNPKAGAIKPRDIFKVTVSLKPLETGILEQIYIPCFVGRVEEPEMLTVMCAVDNIRVCFSLPTRDGHHRRVLWPPQVIDEYNFQYYNLPVCEEDIASTNTLNVVPHLDTGPCYQKILKAKSDYGQLLCDSSPKQSQAFDINRLICGEQTPQSISSESSAAKPSITERFGSELVLEDHYFEITDVPIKTPVKKTIIMHNLTPMTSSFTAEVTNYEPLCVKPSSFEELLQKAGLQKTDTWDKIIYPGSGMVVKINPNCKQFYGRQEIEIDIWIYANTWGVYIEEVVIELKDVPPFCLSIIVEVIGSPVEFPFALNSLHETPVLRLGDIPIGSQSIKRQLKIKNISSIPISMFWHLFISPNENVTNRFNLVYHIKDINALEFKHSHEANEELKLLLSEYYGAEASVDVFQVESRQINLLPNTTSSIHITFSPQNYCKKYYNRQIDAILVGYIDIAEEYRYKPNYFIRSVNTDLGPSIVKISGTIRLPLLHIEHVKGDLRITAFASDIIQNGGFSYTQRLVFRNTNTAIAKVGMHIKKPFNVVCLKTCGMDREDCTVAAVQPGACVEVYVECTLDIQHVEDYANALYNRNLVMGGFTNSSNNSVVVRRNLNIHQKGVVVLVTPLDLILYYPIIEVEPATINFGSIWIGNSSKASFTIYNYSETIVRYTLEFSSQLARNVFVIASTEGEIPRASGPTRGEKIVQVRFIPNEVQWYNETLKIVTDIRTYYREINLVANGTINQKFYAVED